MIVSSLEKTTPAAHTDFLEVTFLGLIFEFPLPLQDGFFPMSGYSLAVSLHFKLGFGVFFSRLTRMTFSEWWDSLT